MGEICGAEKCIGIGTFEFVTCTFCEKDFHLKCYGLSKTAARTVGEHNNILFTCDGCIQTVNPTSVCELVSYKFTVQSDIDSIKKSLASLDSAMITTNNNLPSTSTFNDLTRNIDELTVAVKSMPQSSSIENFNKGIQLFAKSVETATEHGIMSNSTEMVDIMRGIQTSLAQNQMVIPNEMKEILSDIRSSLKTNTMANAQSMHSKNTPNSRGNKRQRELSTSDDWQAPKRAEGTDCVGPSS